MKHNCWSCVNKLMSNECRVVLLEERQEVDDWADEHIDYEEDELATCSEDVDGCPGWKQKASAC